MYLLRLLIDGGPLVLLLTAIGAAAAVWGAVNLIRGANRTAMAVQLGLALLPAALGAVGTLLAILDFSEFARSPAPKPKEFVEIVARGFACGFWGCLMTLLAAVPGVAALSRHAARRTDRPAPAD